MCGRRIVGEENGQGSDDDEESESEREERIQRLKWEKLNPYITSSFRRTPTVDFMYVFSIF